MLKEYRCEYCNKLFFKGEIKEATIEIKCRYCKKLNLIKAAILLNDGETKYKPAKKNESR